MTHTHIPLKTRLDELLDGMGTLADTSGDDAARARLIDRIVETCDDYVSDVRRRLLSAAGDDLCRFSPEELAELTSGRVPIPPEEEFIPSCRRFHAQVASEAGVNTSCYTLAQLVAENERQRLEIDALVEETTDRIIDQLRRPE